MSADYQCPGCAGRLAVSSVGGVRQYVCENCAGHVVTIVGLRHLAPDAANALWNNAADLPAEEGLARCPFCQRQMQTKPFPAGRAATCRPCEAIWLDKIAAGNVEVKPAPGQTPSLHSSTRRCENCGAVVEDTADGNCRYCGKPLELPTKVVVVEGAPSQRPDQPWGGAGARILGGIVGGLIDEVLGGPF